MSSPAEYSFSYTAHVVRILDYFLDAYMDGNVLIQERAMHAVAFSMPKKQMKDAEEAIQSYEHDISERMPKSDALHHSSDSVQTAMLMKLERLEMLRKVMQKLLDESGILMPDYEMRVRNAKDIFRGK